MLVYSGLCTEWKTLQEILQCDADDRRRIIYFRDVAVGWMEATDVDVLSIGRENEILFPQRDDSGRLMNRRPCPKLLKDLSGRLC